MFERTYNGDRVEAYDMTAKQIAEYNKGYDDNEAAKVILRIGDDRNITRNPLTGASTR